MRIMADHISSLWFLNCLRFKGELFGLGSNHTKYKSKNYGQSNGNGGQQQLQYSTSVHYPMGMNGHNNQTMAPGNFTYEEGY